MKKLAILIATLLIVCLMACACGKVEEPAPTPDAPTSEAPTSEAPTSQAPTSQAPTSQAPTSQAPTSQAPTSQAPNPGPSTTPSTGTLFDFGSVSGFAKGDLIAAGATETFGQYTLTEGNKFQTSLGKTYKGPEGNTTFLQGWQMGKNGSFVKKSIQFTVTEATTLSVYVNVGSTDFVDGTITLGTSAGVTSTHQFTVDEAVSAITRVDIAIPAAGTYAIWEGSNYSSINVWGLKL